MIAISSPESGPSVRTQGLYDFLDILFQAVLALLHNFPGMPFIMETIFVPGSTGRIRSEEIFGCQATAGANLLME
jgi:hypothetical protein